jgi:hypothetical protein
MLNTLSWKEGWEGSIPVCASSPELLQEGGMAKGEGNVWVRVIYCSPPSPPANSYFNGELSWAEAELLLPVTKVEFPLITEKTQGLQALGRLGPTVIRCL